MTATVLDPVPAAEAICTLDDCKLPAVFEVIPQGHLQHVFACRVHDQMARNASLMIARIFDVHLFSRTLTP